MRIGVIGGDIIGLSFALLCEKHNNEVVYSESKDDFIFNLNNKICPTNVKTKEV